jgi:hypothetical protein
MWLKEEIRDLISANLKFIQYIYYNPMSTSGFGFTHALGHETQRGRLATIGVSVSWHPNGG